jgi:hypothetical protein
LKITKSIERIITATVFIIVATLLIFGSVTPVAVVMGGGEGPPISYTQSLIGGLLLILVSLLLLFSNDPEKK